MRWILETYLTNPAECRDWRVAPLTASLAGLPRAHLIVGDHDPLLDDSRRLAARLTEAGVPNALTVYPGLNHGFIRYGRFVATVRRAVEESAAALRLGSIGL
jgi:acetyl esterase